MDIIQSEGGPLLAGVVRETIFLSSGGAIRREIERLAKERGEYMLLHRTAAILNVAVSPSEGCLLAECLRDEFGGDFVYVEHLADDQVINRYILVAVVDGVVQLDSVVLSHEIKDVLAGFFVGGKVDVRLSGEVPLEQAPEGHPEDAGVAADGVFMPNPSFVRSWEQVGDNHRLVVAHSPKSRLKHWKRARDEAVGSTLKGVIALAAMIALVTVAVVSFWPKSEPEKKAEAPPPDPLATPYQAWSSKVSLADAMTATTQVSWFARQPAGWRAKQIKVSGKSSVLVIEQATLDATYKSATEAFGAKGILIGGARDLSVEYALNVAPRGRPQFERLLARAPADVRAVVDQLTQDPWGLTVTVNGQNQGIGYRTATISLRGTMPEVVMEEYARALKERYPNTAVEALEYDPNSAALSLTFTLFVRS